LEPLEVRRRVKPVPRGVARRGPDQSDLVIMVKCPDAHSRQAGHIAYLEVHWALNNASRCGRVKPILPIGMLSAYHTGSRPWGLVITGVQRPLKAGVRAAEGPMTMDFETLPARAPRSIVERFSGQVAVSSAIALCVGILLSIGSPAEAAQGCDPSQPWQPDRVLNGHDT